MQYVVAQQPLLDTMGSAADVRAWCTQAVSVYAADYPVRCPIGSLVNELGEAEPAARHVLAQGLDMWTSKLREGLERTAARGELVGAATPSAVAHPLLAAYQGGVLLASAAGTLTPLRLALAGVSDTALVAPLTDPSSV